MQHKDEMSAAVVRAEKAFALHHIDGFYLCKVIWY